MQIPRFRFKLAKHRKQTWSCFGFAIYDYLSGYTFRLILAKWYKYSSVLLGNFTFYLYSLTLVVWCSIQFNVFTSMFSVRSSFVSYSLTKYASACEHPLLFASFNCSNQLIRWCIWNLPGLVTLSNNISASTDGIQHITGNSERI